MIPVITYHSLGNSPSPIYTPVEVFEAQMEALASAGYRTVSMSAVVNWLKGGPEPDINSIVLSFDDGYRSVYTEAWPRLKALGFSAIIFLVTDYCGRDNQWPGQPLGVPVEPLMNWPQIAELAAEGCEFGAHTLTHRPLPVLTPVQAEDEIAASKAAVSAHTGQSANIFAFPYGTSDAAIDEVVKRHFDGAVSTKLGVVQRGDNPYKLARIDAFYLNPRFVPHMQKPVFHRYLRVRQGLRDVRRRFRSDWQLI
jgi:peptidoglycan/xylan/chitin deacetylase (PgdA/CDA1 family)